MAADVKLVSVIIPAYNERSDIEEVLRRVLDAPLPRGLSREVIVVDDGSNDGTSEILEKCAAGAGRTVVRVHHSVLNFGKGTAIRIGIRQARGEVIIIQDGDLEYDPNDYPRLLAPILAGEADVVYGSRFLGDPKGMQLPNLVFNRSFTALTNVLFTSHLTDEATAYKVFRAEVLKGIPLACTRFEFCPEVTAKVLKRGIRIHEVPISYTARTTRQGKKIKWTDAISAVATILKYRVVD